MKRFSSFVGLALLTFGVGVGAVCLYARASALLAAALSPRAGVGAARAERAKDAPRADDAVKINLLRVYRREGVLVADFKVTNSGLEVLSYFAFSRDSNPMWSVRRGRRSEHAAPLSCGTGLRDFYLFAGQSATFAAPVGEPGYVQVGFDFNVGAGDRTRTIWSEEVFVAEP